MTDTATRTYKVGDLVTPDPNYYGVPANVLGKVYRVAKVNPKNLRCTPVDAPAGTRGLNYPPAALLPSDGTPQHPARVTLLPLPEPADILGNGEIVTLKGGFAKFGWTDTTPLIVLADKGQRVNLARLGGSGTQYVRAGRNGIVKRDLAWLTETLVAAL